MPTETVVPEIDTDFGAGAPRERHDLVVDTISAVVLIEYLDQEPFDRDGLDAFAASPLFDVLDLHLEIPHVDLHFLGWG